MPRTNVITAQPQSQLSPQRPPLLPPQTAAMATTTPRPPSIHVDTNTWMLNPNEWQQAIIRLAYEPTIDICPSKSNAQLPRFAGPEGGGVHTDWRW
ncbi:hypothetical protein SARC_03178 [Sphaeroforma arctica JP610]|uniref:Uncharacterized protein n=1 Tax=Sphaeroforma arctica JP610 TaxID=667725 RepID=A0A0L0G6X2_9EUKA|nr:hypothetical protein SARC_03178 [Sphaeroforma arctica JP610]KNC84611.1 hypothetical protein SARC_03178 [Sphaeroforma arctica JP610]|eukprot:XP_014158513.1 hypothetical protein SARC_03178 [Sphaeroforma arctica JP610]